MSTAAVGALRAKRVTSPVSRFGTEVTSVALEYAGLTATGELLQSVCRLHAPEKGGLSDGPVAHYVSIRIRL